MFTGSCSPSNQDIQDNKAAAQASGSTSSNNNNLTHTTVYKILSRYNKQLHSFNTIDPQCKDNGITLRYIKNKQTLPLPNTKLFAFPTLEDTINWLHISTIDFKINNTYKYVFTKGFTTSPITIPHFSTTIPDYHQPLSNVSLFWSLFKNNKINNNPSIKYQLLPPQTIFIDNFTLTHSYPHAHIMTLKVNQLKK